MPESKERGALTEAVLYILLTIYHQPLHGYGIMQSISELSGGRVNLGAGTLYGAINTLLEKGWIKSVGAEKNSRKKEYIITELGKSTVSHEKLRLAELMDNVQSVTGGGEK